MLYLKNKITGEVKSVEEGFNWKVFLFGWVYLLIVGDYAKALVLILLWTILTCTLFSIPSPVATLGCAFLSLIVNACAAWNYHKEYQKILEKRDFVLHQK